MSDAAVPGLGFVTSVSAAAVCSNLPAFHSIFWRLAPSDSLKTSKMLRMSITPANL